MKKRFSRRIASFCIAVLVAAGGVTPTNAFVSSGDNDEAERLYEIQVEGRTDQEFVKGELLVKYKKNGKKVVSAKVKKAREKLAAKVKLIWYPKE